MPRALRFVVFGFVGYVGLALGISSIGWIAQPPLGSDRTRDGVLRTFASDGPEERRLAVFDVDGAVWVVSVQHFRGWYDRLSSNPEVELERDGETHSYRAVPVDDAADRFDSIVRERAGGQYWVMRAVWLFAPFKPVRLDPR